MEKVDAFRDAVLDEHPLCVADGSASWLKRRS